MTDPDPWDMYVSGYLAGQRDLITQQLEAQAQQAGTNRQYVRATIRDTEALAARTAA